jgi:TolA-binding protein
VATGEKLRQRYPKNDDIDFAIADLYSSASVENYSQAAAAYQEVIDRRRVDASLDGSIARYRALSGLSGARQNQWRLDEAIAALAPPIDAGVTSPDWVLPQFLLRRANLRALLNDPSAADDAKRVLGDARLAKWHANATSLVTWIDQRRANGEAATYASLIPANRLVAEGKFDEARRLYQPIRAASPQSPLVAYRLAYLEFARGDSERALAAFATIAANRTAPSNLRASALLYVGRAHDLAGRREQARQTYQKVIDDFEKERAAGSAKVGLVTPYKRPSAIQN